MVRIMTVMTNNSYEELCLGMNLLFFFFGKNNCLKGISSKDIFKNIIFAHVVEYSTFQKGRA